MTDRRCYAEQACQVQPALVHDKARDCYVFCCECGRQQTWMPPDAEPSLAVVLVLLAVVIAVLCTGCSGISQAEWDDLQSKHKATLMSLEKAEAERVIAADRLKASAEMHAKAAELLRRAAQWIRDHNGGVLPW